MQNDPNENDIEENLEDEEEDDDNICIATILKCKKKRKKLVETLDQLLT